MVNNHKGRSSISEVNRKMQIKTSELPFHYIVKIQKSYKPSVGRDVSQTLLVKWSTATLENTSLCCCSHITHHSVVFSRGRLAHVHQKT